MTEISQNTADLYERALGPHQAKIDWKTQDGIPRYKMSCSCGWEERFTKDSARVARQIRGHQDNMAFYAKQAQERGYVRQAQVNA